VRKFLLGLVVGGALVFLATWRAPMREAAAPAPAPTPSAAAAATSAPAVAPAPPVAANPPVAPPVPVEPPVPVAPVPVPPSSAAARPPARPGAVAADPPRPPAEPAPPALNRDDIKDAISAARPAVQRCYEDALKGNPDLAGNLKVRFTVVQSGGTGHLRDAEIAEDDTGNPFLGMCALKALAEVEFPAPGRDGVVTVTYPFRFQAAR
jgi:outer membrane biosynthesis protein TonB